MTTATPPSAADLTNKSALGCLKQALLHRKFGLLCLRASKHALSAKHLQTSLDALPTADTAFHLGLAYYGLRPDRLADAERAFETATRLDSGMSGAYVNLMVLKMLQGDDDGATAMATRALEIKSDCPEAVMNLSNILRSRGAREEAISLVWRHIQDFHPHHEAQRDSSAATIDVSEMPSDDGSLADTPVAVVCVKWGKRYPPCYVNRLFWGVRRSLSGSSFSWEFRCYCDDGDGLADGIKTHHLPPHLTGWWGKSYLFHPDAQLEGRRCVYIDLDTVVTGPLEPLMAAYRGAFGLLGTDDIHCELAKGGYNSSVIIWTGQASLRPISTALTPAVRRYVHRFDHWLEMMVAHAHLLNQLPLPHRIVDFCQTFRTGAPRPRCVFMTGESTADGGPCEDNSGAGEGVADGESEGGAVCLPADVCLVTFPRSPKPHEVAEIRESRHDWVRQHWCGDDVASGGILPEV